jgi:transcriptional regulator with XRE-family HTH domain
MSEPGQESDKEKNPHPVDVIAGRNLRIARLQAGYSQTRLGEAVGISFQQIQKYERGTNRMSLSRASEFASILNICVAAFFDDAEELPSPAMLEGPWFARWMALYATAHNTGRLSDIIGLAEQIVQLCETTPREAAQCS